MPRCLWCADPNNENADPGTLCRSHAAEYEGLSVDEMDRRDSTWAAEEYDAMH